MIWNCFVLRRCGNFNCLFCDFSVVEFVVSVEYVYFFVVVGVIYGCENGVFDVCVVNDVVV